MMDSIILSITLGSFFVFIILHIVIFRRIAHRQVLQWMVVVFMTAGLLVFGISTTLLNFQWNVLIFALSVSWVLYGLISLIYILAFFGIIESSIRIRLLGEIAVTPGITRDVLRKRYNRDVIIDKRLKRFLSSGDLSFDGRYYHLKNRFSAYSIPAALFRLVWKLYRGNL